MYAIHYRILFPRTISEKEHNTITSRYIEVITKAGLISRMVNVSMGDVTVLAQFKPLSVNVLNDHMHVLAPSLDRDQHLDWYRRLLVAIGMMAEILECDKAEFIIEYRTVCNRDIDIHRFLVAHQSEFHDMYDGEYASWNCPEEDKYFDSHSIHYRWEKAV